LQAPHLVAREDLHVLDETERFVFHNAAELPLGEARESVARARERAAERARVELERILSGSDVGVCAIVAKDGLMPESLESILAAHPRIHVAEGRFYRDVLLEAASALGLRTLLIPPGALDPSSAAVTAAGKIVGRPWGRDQKLAALAGWRVLENQKGQELATS
jgi:hypothetical protein